MIVSVKLYEFAKNRFSNANLSSIIIFKRFEVVISRESDEGTATGRICEMIGAIPQRKPLRNSAKTLRNPASQLYR